MLTESFCCFGLIHLPYCRLVLKDTSTCLLGFFLDFHKRFQSACFLAARVFLNAFDVTVALCLAISRRRQFGRKKRISTFNAYLSESIPKHVNRCGSGEVLGELLGELCQVLFHGLLLCPLSKVDLLPYWPFVSRKKHESTSRIHVSFMPGQGNTPSYN